MMSVTGSASVSRSVVGTLRSALTAGPALIALLATLALAPGARAGAGDAGETLPAQPLIAGRPLFQAKGCAGCHTIWGSEHDQRVGPDLGRDNDWHDIMQFVGSLWNHAPAMTGKMLQGGVERPTLSPDEMRRLTAYVFYAKFLGEPGDVERGRKLFDQRLCSRCHQLAGRGGTVGPRLDELKTHVSALFMAQALWNHGPKMSLKMAELNLTRPRLEGDDVADIVAFLRGKARSAAPAELAAAESGSPLAGKTLFRDKGCIRCHAIAGTGGAIGPDLGKRRPTADVGEMAGALWNHGPTMWAKMKELDIPFPKITIREMSDLLAYLYFVQYRGEKGDVKKGGELFQQKSCARCHLENSHGSRVGPDLADSGAARSPFEFASAMWDHALTMEAKTREMHLGWPRFEDDEMRDLYEFLHTVVAIKSPDGSAER